MTRYVLSGLCALYLVAAFNNCSFYYSTYWGRQSRLSTQNPRFDSLVWFVNETPPGDMVRRVLELFTEPQGPN